MSAILRDFWRDDAGLILSAELVIILTIAVLGMVVGLANLQTALIGEFTDLSMAFQSLNQSYTTPSYRGCWKIWGPTSWSAGSGFIDIYDGCLANNAFGNGGCEILSGTSECTTSAGGAPNQCSQSPAAPLPQSTVPNLNPIPALPLPPPETPSTGACSSCQ